jgi:hypothetical protein
MSKIFTSIINKRIYSYCEENCLLSDAQFGFRKGKSTVDALFVLSSIVQKYINDNKRLYCVFVDFKKAFDSVYRNALWLKLHKSGIRGKLLRIVKDMYNKVKSCIKVCNSYSEFFEYAVGLRQGEIISPVLFSLFIDDIELFLQHDINCGLQLNDIILILLLFADDMAILGNSPEEINNSLVLLHNYCTKWSLEVNVDKTKVMVFRKRGGLLSSENFLYNDKRLEVVNDFNYLGTVFNYTGNFALNQEQLVGKALKALNVLLINCNKYKLKPKLLCQLFDSFVGSILNYAAEIWGHSKSKEIERIHLKFCKRILNVNIRTSNAAVYGELARYPLYIGRYVKIIKYWFRLLETDNIILKEVYNLCLSDCNNGKSNWLTKVKNLLYQYGFNYVWDDPTIVNSKSFIPLFKQRLIDTFIQSWHVDKENSGVLTLYTNLKDTFLYEPYLDILPSNLRLFISKIRMSSHSLRIQTGRYGTNRVARNERYCTYCNTQDLEDEYHFILICPCYNNIRKKYIKRYYYINPSVIKLVELLNSKNKIILKNLACYIKLALSHRTSITYN